MLNMTHTFRAGGSGRVNNSRWVNRVVLAVGQPLPVFPYKQTLPRSAGMSLRCQFRKGPHSFDHLVGGDQQGWRNGQPEGLGGLEVDHLFEAGRLLDR